MRHLNIDAERAAVLAIDDGSATKVCGASFEEGDHGQYRIDFYCYCGQLIRDEYNCDTSRHHVEEMRGDELADFKSCHKIE